MSEEPNRNKTYIGDGVYAEYDGWHIVLYTDHGGGPENTIYLEPNVYSLLKMYAEKVWGKEK